MNIGLDRHDIRALLDDLSAEFLLGEIVAELGGQEPL